MRLWLLKRTDADLRSSFGYDEAHGFVVRAIDELHARAFVSDMGGDEPRETWTDDRRSTCVELTCDGPTEMLLRDYNAA